MSSIIIFVEKIVVSLTAISLLEIAYKAVIPLCTYKDFNRISFLNNHVRKAKVFCNKIYGTNYIISIVFLKKNSELYLILLNQEIKSLNKNPSVIKIESRCN